MRRPVQAVQVQSDALWGEGLSSEGPGTSTQPCNTGPGSVTMSQPAVRLTLPPLPRSRGLFSAPTMLLSIPVLVLM